MATSLRWDTSLVTPPRGTLDYSDLESDPNQPDFVGDDYREMFASWELIEDLCGNSDSMIRKHRRWLPQEPGEEDKWYVVRLVRSILFGFFSETVDSVSRKPFARDLKIAGELPERLAGIVEDADLEGTTLHSLAHDLLRDAIKYGHGIVFVDFSGDVRGATLADEQASGTRPYFVRIEPPNLLGWRTERLPSGERALTQVRFREWDTREDGKYGEVTVERIRIVNAPRALIAPSGEDDAESAAAGRGTFEVWERTRRFVGRSRGTKKQDQWVLTDNGTHSFPGVPLTWFAAREVGFLRSRPPLEELAEQNLCHWQIYSDHKNLLRHAAVAVLFGKRLARGEGEDPQTTKRIVVSANKLVTTEDKDGDLKYVEISGAGNAAISGEILRIEERAEALSKQPLLPRAGTMKATTEIRDDTNASSSLRSWIRLEEGCLRSAFEMAAAYVGEEIPEDFAVEIFDDVDLPIRKNEDLAELSKARERNDIDRQTYLEKLVKFGVLDEEDDIEEILGRVDAERVAEQPMLSPEQESVLRDAGEDPGGAGQRVPPEEVPGQRGAA